MLLDVGRVPGEEEIDADVQRHALRLVEEVIEMDIFLEGMAIPAMKLLHVHRVFEQNAIDVEGDDETLVRTLLLPRPVAEGVDPCTDLRRTAEQVVIRLRVVHCRSGAGLFRRVL
jgi:hypothetical protein